MPKVSSQASNPAASDACSGLSLADPRLNRDGVLDEPNGKEVYKQDVALTSVALSGESRTAAESLKRKFLFPKPRGKCIVSYHCVFVVLYLLLVDLFCMGVVTSRQPCPRGVPMSSTPGTSVSYRQLLMCKIQHLTKFSKYSSANPYCYHKDAHYPI